jgi:hypothetical protein
MAPRLKSALIGTTATLIGTAAILLALSGCGSSSEQTQTAPPASTSGAPKTEAPVGVRAKPCSGETATTELRVTGVSCDTGRFTVAAWSRNPRCAPPAGASRSSCRMGRLTCLGAVTDRGVAVTCAEAGRSISFIGRHR